MSTTIVALGGFNWFNRRKSKKESASAPVEPKKQLVSESTPASAPQSAASDDAVIAAAIAASIAAAEDRAVLAAITAAISVIWESECPGSGFRVVSYRHIDKRSPWNA